jgi:predicted nucleic acid-binding protein
MAKPVIICNTGPLIALECVGLLHLPGTLYGLALIPDAVECEFLAGQTVGTSFDELKRAGLIQVPTLSVPLDPLLATLLDAGEAAVIQLARALNINKVLIDERKGRKVARDIYGLSTIGTVRVLLDAKQRGLIESVNQPLTAMREHGYRIHDKILQAARQQANE